MPAAILTALGFVVGVPVKYYLLTRHHTDKYLDVATWIQKKGLSTNGRGDQETKSRKGNATLPLSRAATGLPWRSPPFEEAWVRVCPTWRNAASGLYESFTFANRYWGLAVLGTQVKTPLSRCDLRVKAAEDAPLRTYICS